MHDTISLFIVLIFLSGKVICQDFTDSNFADKLYKTGDYYNAITEYKRVLFFKTGNVGLKKRGQIYFKIGQCYKKGGFKDNSLFYYTKAIENEPDLHLKNLYQMNFALIWMQKKGYTTAEMELKNLLDKNITKTFRDSVYYYLGWNSLHEYNWSKAAGYFKKINKSNFNMNRLLESCTKAKQLELKSPKKAVVLSTLIPGAGQIYSGEIFDGTVALVLNSSIIYFLIDSIIDKRYTDTAMIYFLLFNRYYPTNRTNAYKYVLRYNLGLKKGFLKNLINEFQFNY